MNRKLLLGGLLVIIIIGLAGFALSNLSFDRSPDQDQSEVVATVNGQNITRQDLNAEIKQIEADPTIQIPDIKDVEARGQFEVTVLNQLINDHLLLAQAKEAGFTADSGEIDSQLNLIKSQFASPALFSNQLNQFDLTENDLTKNIERQIILGQYFDQLAIENNIVVSAEEIQTFFDEQVASQNPEATLEDVALQIEVALKQQRLQDIASNLVANLRNTAQIEILI